MPRFAQVNQFNKGMNKDLHPMVVPKDVLTDCLNGTIITYNGNEFMLQNDMGNYAFTNGPLNNGFVPVGMKEHGGILYIISYNPIKNLVEIGTFPSQKTIFSTDDNKSEKSTFQPLELDFEKEFNFYSDVQANSKLIIFDKGDDFYLNPGDKYLIAVDGSDQSDLNHLLDFENWQDLSPYVLTDDNKIYDLSSYGLNIKGINGVVNRDDYEPIKWEIPGWLCAAFNIKTPSEFDGYFIGDSNKTTRIYQKDDDGNIVKDENGNDVVLGWKITPSGDLKLQTIWSIPPYIDYIKENLTFLLVNIKNGETLKDALKRNQDPFDVGTKYEINDLSYNKEQIILYSVVNEEIVNAQSEEEFKYTHVVPALRIPINSNQRSEEKFTYLVYDQFLYTIERNEKTIWKKDLNFFDDVFKYYTDNNSWTLQFSCDLAPGAIIETQLYRYKDERYDDNYDYDYVYGILDSNKKRIPKAKEWTGINYNGENIFDFEFTRKNQLVNWKLNPENSEFNTTFDKEDIYLLEITAKLKTENDYETILTDSRVVYISEVSNYWWGKYNNYGDGSDGSPINAEKFRDKMEDYINIAVKNINAKQIGESTINSSWDKQKEKILKSDTIDLITSPNISNLEDINELFASNIEITSEKRYKKLLKIFERYAYTVASKSDIEFSFLKNQYSEFGKLWNCGGDYSKTVKKTNKDSYFVDTKGERIDIDWKKDYLGFDLTNTYTITLDGSNLNTQMTPEYIKMTDLDHQGFVRVLKKHHFERTNLLNKRDVELYSLEITLDEVYIPVKMSYAAKDKSHDTGKDNGNAYGGKSYVEYFDETKHIKHFVGVGFKNDKPYYIVADSSNAEKLFAFDNILDVNEVYRIQGASGDIDYSYEHSQLEIYPFIYESEAQAFNRMTSAFNSLQETSLIKAARKVFNTPKIPVLGELGNGHPAAADNDRSEFLNLHWCNSIDNDNRGEQYPNNSGWKYWYRLYKFISIPSKEDPFILHIAKDNSEFLSENNFDKIAKYTQRGICGSTITYTGDKYSGKYDGTFAAIEAYCHLLYYTQLVDDFKMNPIYQILPSLSYNQTLSQSIQKLILSGKGELWYRDVDNNKLGIEIQKIYNSVVTNELDYRYIEFENIQSTIDLNIKITKEYNDKLVETLNDIILIIEEESYNKYLELLETKNYAVGDVVLKDGYKSSRYESGLKNLQKVIKYDKSSQMIYCTAGETGYNALIYRSNNHYNQIPELAFCMYGKTT